MKKGMIEKSLKTIEDKIWDLSNEMDDFVDTVEHAKNVLEFIEEIAYMTEDELKEKAQDVIDKAFSLT